MSLTEEQVQALLRPINPSRVLRDNKGMAHVSQQDIRAHLTRIFGFGGWSSELLNLTCVHEGKVEGKNGWGITYRAIVRLTVRDPEGNAIASYDDVGTGTSPNLPTLGDGHDFAAKVAVSMALKRAATNLGDGFGLSLYNKGQTSPLVIGTLVMPDGDGRDVQDNVPAQVSMGHDDAGSAEHLELPPASTPLQGPVDPAPQATTSPVEPAVPEPTEAEREALIAESVRKLRDRAMTAVKENKTAKDRALALSRISIEASHEHLLEQMTTRENGEPVSLRVYLDDLLAFVSRAKP